MTFKLQTSEIMKQGKGDCRIEDYCRDQVRLKQLQNPGIVVLCKYAKSVWAHSDTFKKTYYEKGILDMFIRSVGSRRSDESWEASALVSTRLNHTAPQPKVQEVRKAAHVSGRACPALLSHHLMQSGLCPSSVRHFKGSHLSSGWQQASHLGYALFKAYAVQGSPPKWVINGLRPSQSNIYSRIS